ncbi:hypothetical protein A3K63_01720 [Candidatus Micrarchaeota archaeon RBG_16_49_10]|nr:MAG: hypothetical protein A3K63_01720 [Candidatus Micrarchaeota archaeon RBG_16_49_10]
MDVIKFNKLNNLPVKMGEPKIRLMTTEDMPYVMGLYHHLSDSYDDNIRSLKLALEHPSTMVFVAVVDSHIVGTAALSMRAVPSYGLVGYIDDVVVDPSYRGKGYGKLITKFCADEAARLGCGRLELTCHPSRKEANQLYKGLGFSQRDTNVYVLHFK